MIDVDEYDGEEWIARSRGNDDEAITLGWTGLEAKGFAAHGALTDVGRELRIEMEHPHQRTHRSCVERSRRGNHARLLRGHRSPHHDAFLARINATAGPRWMPAIRQPQAHTQN